MHIFWDFDGTLVQSSPLWRRAMLEALDREQLGHKITLADLGPLVSVGFPWHSDHAHGITSSAEWWECMETKFAKDFVALGFSQEIAKRAAAQIKPRILDANAYREFAGLKEILKNLRDAGWRQIVLSNNHPDLKLLVDSLGMSQFFDHVVTSGEVGFEKPRPEIFHFARDLCGADFEKSWMVGDSLKADCEGARGVNLRSILVHAEAAWPLKAKDLLEVRNIILSSD